MGARAILQLDTPWAEDEVFDLGYEQTADVVVFTHLRHRQTSLTRYAHDTWTIIYSNYLATVAAPGSPLATGVAANTGTGYAATTYTYVLTTIDEATGQESLPTAEFSNAVATDLTLKGNEVNISSLLPTGAERINVYRKGGGAFGFIGTSEDGTFTDDNIAPDFSQSYPRQKDPFTVGDTSDLSGDKPAVVTFWDQRAIYGRTLNKPNGVFASQSANLFNFNAARPVQGSDAVTFAVSGRRVNAVLHLVPLKNLIVFTTDTIFSIGKDFQPTNVEINPESYRGASSIRPVVIDDIILFECAKGSSLRTLGYEFQADGYRGNDLGVFAPHFFRDQTLVDLCWSEFPTSTVHAVSSDGGVRLLTWQREQEVWGWAKMQTDGVVESACTVSEGGEDVVYYVVRRLVNGVQRRYVEYSSTPRWQDVKDCVYMDSALTYVGEPKTLFSGLQHLEGKEIVVLADGAVYQDVVVIGGAFTIPVPAGTVTAGLPYEAWIRCLPFGEQSQKGEPKTLAGAAVRVMKTRGIEVGIGKDLPPGQFEPLSSDDEIAGMIDEIKTRSLEPFGEPTRLFTGELLVDTEAGDWRTADVVVRQRYPLPMTVLGITPEYVLSN